MDAKRERAAKAVGKLLARLNPGRRPSVISAPSEAKVGKGPVVLSGLRPAESAGVPRADVPDDFNEGGEPVLDYGDPDPDFDGAN